MSSLALLILLQNQQPLAQVELDISLLEQKQGIYYQTGQQLPFTGVALDTNFRRQLVAGKYHGLSRFYWPDGTLKSELEYHNGTVHGSVKFYYKNGQLAYQGSRWQGRETQRKTTCYDERGTPLEQCTRYAMSAGQRK